ncbi:hypothetical protein TREMEDRAFT_61178 [Tremella mesenterica DSM 1558]|uniref:uncharacterized protein n=1 Tax=Tremella mesenterica (strain ATCC 24925 / CBS 8224 / DSM 1558 / NBRC 9311 / NRRL Y-6157 / RJB 2259-6 / UBC 559-6) TaxID=578456 RepID=UPI0003F4A267|nr:uncharacterized protein TREMEDRAFT_61178 [Tremella mesenterica DSM 1558]EIW70670.1 hypothetical protein TREMEDRAFT_61178 [Tremella mesenterica DSM 1558]
MSLISNTDTKLKVATSNTGNGFSTTWLGKAIFDYPYISSPSDSTKVTNTILSGESVKETEGVIQPSEVEEIIYRVNSSNQDQENIGGVILPSESVVETKEPTVKKDDSETKLDFEEEETDREESDSGGVEVPMEYRTQRSEITQKEESITSDEI